jgi:NADPH:quinone reductase-like Zn-dependent oxidoreductase
VGKLTPVIGRSYPLGEVPEAMRQMVEGRGGGGKIVITI